MLIFKDIASFLLDKIKPKLNHSFSFPYAKFVVHGRLFASLIPWLSSNLFHTKVLVLLSTTVWGSLFSSAWNTEFNDPQALHHKLFGCKIWFRIKPEIFGSSMYKTHSIRQNIGIRDKLSELLFCIILFRHIMSTMM